MLCLVAVKDIHSTHVVPNNYSRVENMSFTRKVYTEVPRQLFQLIKRLTKVSCAEFDQLPKEFLKKKKKKKIE